MKELLFHKIAWDFSIISVCTADKQMNTGKFIDKCMKCLALRYIISVSAQEEGVINNSFEGGAQ